VDRRGRVRVNLGSRREGFILRYALQADSTRNPSELEGRWAFSSEDGDLSGDAFFTNDEDDFDDDDNF